jgi:hypothetical protein
MYDRLKLQLYKYYPYIRKRLNFQRRVADNDAVQEY